MQIFSFFHGAHNLPRIFSALQSPVNLHRVLHPVLPPYNFPTLLLLLVLAGFPPLSSTIPSNHPHLFKQGFNDRTGSIVFTLMLVIRQTSVVSWRQELTGASRAEPINTARMIVIRAEHCLYGGTCDGAKLEASRYPCVFKACSFNCSWFIWT